MQSSSQLLEQLDADLPFVHAEADGAHRAGIAQLAHGAIAAVEKFAHARGVRIAMREPADVVAQQDVDARNAETLEALGMRTHDRVVAVVEHRRERPRREIALAADACILRTGGHEAAADLGGDHRRRLRATQRLAEPQLAQAEAVERRGVEVAHARGEGLAHRGAGIFIGELAIQVADGRRRRTRAC